MEGTSEVAAVREALDAGRLTVPDPETGFHHAMYAVCPHDGAHAPVRRVVRGSPGGHHPGDGAVPAVRCRDGARARGTAPALTTAGRPVTPTTPDPPPRLLPSPWQVAWSPCLARHPRPSRTGGSTAGSDRS